MKQVRSYRSPDTPEVEVLWEGQWCYGTLHEWRQDDGGRWSGWVRFNVAPGENRIDVFDQDDLRRAPGTDGGGPTRR